MIIDINKIVQVSNYGSGTKSYGNTNQINIGNLTLWFSYETIIAFADNSGRVVCENLWSNTTGKHLNLIDSDKSKRVSRKVFEDELKQAFIRNGLINLKEEIAKTL